MPNGSGDKSSGVAGVQKLIGTKALRRLEKEEQNRVLECARKFLSPNGIAVAFQKNAWSGLKSKKDILYCIDTARQAPSGMNSQPWRFLIIKDVNRKKEIKKLCEDVEKDFHKRVGGDLSKWLKRKKISWEKDFLQEADFLVLVFSFRKAPYSVHSTWLAIGYFLLALEEKYLSTVPYTPPNWRKISKLLNVP